MIVLYVILAIILFIFIILHFSIVAEANISNNKKELVVKFLFFKIYPLKEKKKNKKPKKSKNKKRKSKKLKSKKRKRLEEELVKEKEAYEKALTEASGKSEQILKQKTQDNIKKDEKIKSSEEKENKEKNRKKEKSTESKLDELKEKWEKIKPYIPIGKKVVKKLVKSIRISNLFLNLAIANEDAYECAMSFGKTNIAVYNSLSVLKLLFTVKVKKINITSKFNSPDTDYEFMCKVKTRPSTIIAIAFCALVSYLMINFKKKRLDNKSEKENKETEMLKNG